MNPTPSAGLGTRIKRLLGGDIWDIDLTSLSAERLFLVRLLRVGQLIVRGFKEDDLPVHASALTFVTLMSLVPILAVTFAMLKAFGFAQTQMDQILTWKTTLPPDMQRFVDNLLDIVQNTNITALGVVGVVFLIVTSIMVLASVEVSFGRIWGITKARPVLRKIANYIAIIVIVPLLLAIAGTLEASLKSGGLILPETVGWALRNLLQLTSFFTTWMAFWCLYLFVPNTRVRLGPSLLAGLVGALLFMLWQKIYLGLQLGVGRYNAIYGGFASIPIFLVFLYNTWVIVLLGAELCFALQNAVTFQLESSAMNASARARLILAVSIARAAADAFLENRPRFEIQRYAREHRVPIRLVNDIVRLLVRRNVLVETAEPPGAFILTRAPETLGLSELADLVLADGVKPEALGLTDTRDAEAVRRLDEGIEASLGSLNLRELALQSAPARKGG